MGGKGAVTPHDTDALGYTTRQLYIGGAGNIVVVWVNSAETTEPVAAGERVPWCVTHIKATGTTATGIRAFV
jgi:hypothetical protein